MSDQRLVLFLTPTAFAVVVDVKLKDNSVEGTPRSGGEQRSDGKESYEVLMRDKKYVHLVHDVTFQRLLEDKEPYTTKYLKKC